MKKGDFGIQLNFHYFHRKSKRYMSVPSIAPLLLTMSFLLFNVVPDVIFLFLQDWTTFEVRKYFFAIKEPENVTGTLPCIGNFEL